MAHIGPPREGSRCMATRFATGASGPLVGHAICAPPSRKGSGSGGSILVHTGSLRREPDHRRESAKTASPINKRATILDGASRRSFGVASKRQQGVAPALPSADLRAPAMVAPGRTRRYTCRRAKEDGGG